MLTQCFSHRSLSRPHKRAGVKTEIAVAFVTGFRLSDSGRYLSHSGTLACPRLDLLYRLDGNFARLLDAFGGVEHFD